MSYTPKLEIHRLDDLFPHYGYVADSFVLAYDDQLVGAVAIQVTGGQDSGRWRWGLSCCPSDGSTAGFADSCEEALEAFRARFMRWLRENHPSGRLPPIPPWSRPNMRYVSEILAGRT